MGTLLPSNSYNFVDLTQRKRVWQMGTWHTQKPTANTQLSWWVYKLYLIGTQSDHSKK